VPPGLQVFDGYQLPEEAPAQQLVLGPLVRSQAGGVDRLQGIEEVVQLARPLLDAGAAAVA
jgi:hypothetical protein